MNKQNKQHPYQHIQQQWMYWLDSEPFTYEGYKEFMDWRHAYLILNPID
jgi:hypothetical protein